MYFNHSFRPKYNLHVDVSVGCTQTHYQDHYWNFRYAQKGRICVCKRLRTGKKNMRKNFTKVKTWVEKD